MGEVGVQEFGEVVAGKREDGEGREVESVVNLVREVKEGDYI